MKDKQQSYFVNIGSSSLLVIFLILCLVTFAILSLSSAKSDYTFSERLAEHKKTYYEASAKAEDIVDEIDAILYETSRNVNSASSSHEDGELDLYDNYIFAVSSALNGASLTGTDESSPAEGIPVICEQTKDEFLISFQVPADASQELQVVLRIPDFRTSDYYYEVKTWKIVNTGNRETEEQPLNLIPVL